MLVWQLPRRIAVGVRAMQKAGTGLGKRPFFKARRRLDRRRGPMQQYAGG